MKFEKYIMQCKITENERLELIFPGNRNFNSITSSPSILFFVTFFSTPWFKFIRSGLTEKELYANIRKGEFDTESDLWKAISDNGTDFLRKVLKVNVYERLSIKEMILHPWINSVSYTCIAWDT